MRHNEKLCLSLQFSAWTEFQPLTTQTQIKNRNESKALKNLWIKGTHSVTPSCLKSILNYLLLILFPRTWIRLTKELRCTSLKTMKLWSRWPSKVEVPLKDMFPGPKEALLIGCLTFFWTQRFRSGMWTPRIKLADMLTKGRFTEWNRLLCLCNSSLFSSQRCSAFSSQNCFEALAKR